MAGRWPLSGSVRNQVWGESRTNGSKVWCAHGNNIFIVGCFVEPGRSPKSEQQKTEVTPGLSFLAPCSVEEARTGCRSSLREYSSNSEAIKLRHDLAARVLINLAGVSPPARHLACARRHARLVRPGGPLADELFGIARVHGGIPVALEKDQRSGPELSRGPGAWSRRSNPG